MRVAQEAEVQGLFEQLKQTVSSMRTRNGSSMFMDRGRTSETEVDEASDIRWWLLLWFLTVCITWHRPAGGTEKSLRNARKIRQ